MRYNQAYSFGFPVVTPFVKGLVIANLVSWFLFVLIIQKYFMDSPLVFKYLGLTPILVMEGGFLWQLFTYMFIHAFSLFHIFFNLIVLWMFGSELERLWGSKFFLIYYFSCGVGAAVIYCLVLLGLSFLIPVDDLLSIPVVGSSGAVFGLMAAYGWIFKDRIIYVMMIFPMRARTFTYLLIGIEIFSMLNSGFGGSVANLAHLGGLATGFLFLILWKNWSNIQAKFKRRNYRLHVVKQEDSTKKKEPVWH